MSDRCALAARIARLLAFFGVLWMILSQGEALFSSWIIWFVLTAQQIHGALPLILLVIKGMVATFLTTFTIMGLGLMVSDLVSETVQMTCARKGREE